MTVLIRDIVPISEAQGRLTELAEEVVERGTEKILTKNGRDYVALVDVRKLDHYRALEAEHAGLVLMQDALVGLQDVVEGRVLNEDELDRALSAVSVGRKSLS